MEQKTLKISSSICWSQQGLFYWLNWTADEASKEHLLANKIETWLNLEHHKWGRSNQRKQKHWKGECKAKHSTLRISKQGKTSNDMRLIVSCFFWCRLPRKAGLCLYWEWSVNVRMETSTWHSVRSECLILITHKCTFHWNFSGKFWESKSES